MTHKFLAAVALASLACLSAVAEARPVAEKELGPSINAIEFDLASDGGSAEQPQPANGQAIGRHGAIGPIPREQAAAAAAGLARPDPPLLSYEPLDRGPVLELGALGAKRENMPGLAHIAVNWDF